MSRLKSLFAIVLTFSLFQLSQAKSNQEDWADDTNSEVLEGDSDSASTSTSDFEEEASADEVMADEGSKPAVIERAAKEKSEARETVTKKVHAKKEKKLKKNKKAIKAKKAKKLKSKGQSA